MSVPVWARPPPPLPLCGGPPGCGQDELLGHPEGALGDADGEAGHDGGQLCIGGGEVGGQLCVGGGEVGGFEQVHFVGGQVGGGGGGGGAVCAQPHFHGCRIGGGGGGGGGAG